MIKGLHSTKAKSLSGIKPHLKDYPSKTKENIFFDDNAFPFTFKNMHLENSIDNSTDKYTYGIKISEPPINKNNNDGHHTYEANSTDIKINNYFNNIRRNVSDKNLFKKKYININPEQDSNKTIKRFYSNNLDDRRKNCNNKDYMKNRLNMDNTDKLLQKIRNVSNKLEKTMNLYKEKKFSINKLKGNDDNNDYKTNRCTYNMESYFNRKYKPDNNSYKYKDINITRDCDNRFLEKMRMKNEREKKLIKSKLKNISDIICRKNLMKKMNNLTNKLPDNYKIKMKDKKYSIDNNMNLNDLDEIDRKKYNKYNIYEKNKNQNKIDNLKQYNDENIDINNYTDKNYGTHFRYYLDNKKVDDELKNIEKSVGYFTSRAIENNSFKNKKNKNNELVDIPSYCGKNIDKYTDHFNNNNTSFTENNNQVYQNKNKLDDSSINIINNNKKISYILDKKDERIKNIQDELLESNQACFSFKTKYEKKCEENNELIIKIKELKIENDNYQSDIESLKSLNDKNIRRISELENDNKNLMNKISKNDEYENNYSILKEENINLTHDNQQLREYLKKIDNKYKNVEVEKEENKNNFDELLNKYNLLLEKSKDLANINNKLKNEMIDAKSNTCKHCLERINEKKNYYQKNSDKTNCKFDLEKENIELAKMNEEKDNIINDLELKIKEFENRINDLENKDNNMISYDKEEHSHCKYRICPSNDIITELKNDIYSLNKTIDDKNKEIEELKEKLKQKNNNSFEDEIVIVNKETIFSNGDGKADKYGKIKNSYTVTKKIDLDESQIIKYHEIIQDLSNMILIYENFFFRDKVRPKNNQELFCYLLVNYINNKVKKIKLNALVNLIIHQKINKKKTKYKYNNNINENYYEH